MPSHHSAEPRLPLAEVEATLRALSGADWGRARSLARLCAAGLPAWTGDALLAEALVKLQSGERVWRPGVPTLVTLKVAMRGIASNIRKRDANGPIDPYVTVDGIGDAGSEETGAPTAVAVETITPADITDSRNQLRFVEQLVAGNEDLELLLMAWADDLRGDEAAAELGWDKNRYEAARKRLVRALKPAAALRKQK